MIKSKKYLNFLLILLTAINIYAVNGRKNTLTKNHRYVFRSDSFGVKIEKNCEIRMDVIIPKEVEINSMYDVEIILTSSCENFWYSTFFLSFEKGLCELGSKVETYIRKSGKWVKKSGIAREEHNEKWEILKKLEFKLGTNKGKVSISNILKSFSNWLLDAYEDEIRAYISSYHNPNNELYGMFNAPEGSVISNYSGIKWKLHVKLKKEGIINFCCIPRTNYRHPLLSILYKPEISLRKVQYKSYTNVRFQFSIIYPQNVLIGQGESQNADGQRFISKDDKAVLIAYGSHNSLGQSFEEIYRNFIKRYSNGSSSSNIIYRVKRNDWFVISGYQNDNDDVFYVKVFLRSNKIRAFEFTYPKSQKQFYDPITTVISKSFKCHDKMRVIPEQVHSKNDMDGKWVVIIDCCMADRGRKICEPETKYRWIDSLGRNIPKFFAYYQYGKKDRHIILHDIVERRRSEIYSLSFNAFIGPFNSEVDMIRVLNFIKNHGSDYQYFLEPYRIEEYKKCIELEERKVGHLERITGVLIGVSFGNRSGYFKIKKDYGEEISFELYYPTMRVNWKELPTENDKGKRFLVEYKTITFKRRGHVFKKETEVFKIRRITQHNERKKFTNEADSPFPKLMGWVNDYENILKSDEEAEISAILSEHEKRTTNQIVIAILDRITPYKTIDEYSLNLFNKWGIGQKEKNNGVGLLINMEKKEIRIEVGLGLESVLTNELCANIIRKSIVPEFQKGNYYKGIKKAILDIIRVLE